MMASTKRDTAHWAVVSVVIFILAEVVFPFVGKDSLSSHLSLLAGSLVAGTVLARFIK